MNLKFAESYHWRKERTNRQKLIDKLGGDGKPIASRLMWENESAYYHILTDNCIMLILNSNKQVLLTKKFPSVDELKRFGNVPEHLLKLALIRTKNGIR